MSDNTPSRGYQLGFYEYAAGVRDRRLRLCQAAKIRHILVESVTMPAGALRCLDVGCSSGTITNALAPMFHQTVGLDIDEIALASREHTAGNGVFYLRGDGMNLPFPDASFDVVICAQVYEHMPDSRRLMLEVYRVLTSDGSVFFSGPNWLFPIEPHYFLPFLHWLPRKAAGTYLRVFGKGSHYYEHSRNLWDLYRLVSPFLVRDVTLEALASKLSSGTGLWWLVALLTPRWIWRLLLPFVPNFNWILSKQELKEP